MTDDLSMRVGRIEEGLAGVREDVAEIRKDVKGLVLTQAAEQGRRGFMASMFRGAMPAAWLLAATAVATAAGMHFIH